MQETGRLTPGRLTKYSWEGTKGWGNYQDSEEAGWSKTGNFGNRKSAQKAEQEKWKYTLAVNVWRAVYILSQSDWKQVSGVAWRRRVWLAEVEVNGQVLHGCGRAVSKQTQTVPCVSSRDDCASHTWRQLWISIDVCVPNVLVWKAWRQFTFGNQAIS